MEVAATDEHKKELEKPNLDATAVMNAACAVGDAAMTTLLEIEGKTKGSRKRGYFGVGARVTKLITKSSSLLIIWRLVILHWLKPLHRQSNN